ncbi:hypothetical protein [Nibricoccus sp. IMCC34717]|uniref:hypothetical protein n=1 Tax=Nibricoccus sp. IMCC34717 TaxID=3034021 RepID=UPI00384EFBD0
MTSRLVLALCLAGTLLSGCSKREIHAYRAPKDVDAPLPPALAAAPSPNDMSTGAADLPPPPDAAGLTWQAPSKWPAKALGQMRKGSHSVPGSAGDADFSIIVLPGAAGGLLDNINRWRGQVQLKPVTAAQLPAESETLQSGALKLVIVDLPSPDGKSRILGAIAEVGPNSWFFKMTGPSATVTEAKPDFLAFLQTIKAP